MRADHTQSRIEGFNDGLEAIAEWCAEQRLLWMRERRNWPETAEMAMAKASAYSAAETHARSLMQPLPDPTTQRSYIEAMRGDPGEQR